MDHHRPENLHAPDSGRAGRATTGRGHIASTAAMIAASSSGDGDATCGGDRTCVGVEDAGTPGCDTGPDTGGEPDGKGEPVGSGEIDGKSEPDGSGVPEGETKSLWAGAGLVG